MIRAGAESIGAAASFARPTAAPTCWRRWRRRGRSAPRPRGPSRCRFSALRGERIELREGMVIVDDCYNANPMSMRAAMEELPRTRTGPARRGARRHARARRRGGPALHRGSASTRERAGVELLVDRRPARRGDRCGASAGDPGGPDARAAAELLQELLRDGDTVLVKGSRGVGLERRRAGAAARARARSAPSRSGS